MIRAPALLERAPVSPGAGAPPASVGNGVAPGDAVRTALLLALLAASYYAAARLGLALRVPGTRFGIVIPSHVVLLTAALHVPRQRWWVVALAVVPSHLAAHLSSALPAWRVALQIAHGFVLAFGSAYALKAWLARPLRFDDLQQTGAFVAIAAVMGSAAAALVAPQVVFALADAAPKEVAVVWARVVLADAVGTLTLVPALLVVATNLEPATRGHSSRRAAEVVLLAAMLAVIAVLMFGAPAGAPPASPALLYAPVPFLVWAAARFGSGGAIFSASALAVATITGEALNRGPFTSGGVLPQAHDLQLFLVAATLPLLFLGSLVDERRRTNEVLRAQKRELREQVSHLSAIFRRAPVGLAFIDRDLRFERVNDRLAQVNGLSPADHVGRSMRDVAPALAPLLEPLVRRVLETGGSIVESEVRGRAPSDPSGPDRAWLTSFEAVRGAHDEVVGVSAVVHEITNRIRAEEEKSALLAGLRTSFERIQDLAGRIIEAQDAERSRIARDLHDDVNQQVAALSISLSALKRQLPEDGGELRLAVELLQQRTTELADSIRRVSRDLHPAILQHAGLLAALRTLCGDFGRQRGILVTLDAPESIGRVPSDTALCLYRVTQEAMRNAARHAQAQRIAVTLRAAGTKLELVVADDGTGIDLGQARRRGGLGLVSLEERVRLVGGTLTIQPGSSSGTEVRARVPAGGSDG